MTLGPDVRRWVVGKLVPEFSRVGTNCLPFNALESPLASPVIYKRAQRPTVIFNLTSLTGFAGHTRTRRGF